MVAAFDIRRPTTVMRHSTADSRLLNVGRRSAVGRRMSNVVLRKGPATPQESVGTTQESAVKTATVAVKDAVTTQEDAVKDAVITQESAVKDAVTTQEVAPKTGEVAPKATGVAPKIAPKANGVAPKADDVAPKVDEAAPKIAPKADNVAPKDEESQKSAVKSAVKNLVADERVAEKCITLWSFLKEDPQRTITNAVERLSWSRRSIVTYIGILKQAKVLEHIGPYHGGVWKFLI